MSAWFLKVWDWLSDGAWLAGHPIWRGTFQVAIIAFLVTVTVICFMSIIANMAARRVTRTVFGGSDLPTPAESAQRVARAEADAAASVVAITRTVQTNIRAMCSQVAAREIPLTFAVNTPQEQQILEALIARSHGVRVAVGTIRRNRRNPDADENRDAVPTAWSRILLDDDEEGTPCPSPTIPEPPPPPPEKTPPKKKPSKSKKRRG